MSSPAPAPAPKKRAFFRRRHYIINPAFQWRFIAIMCSVAAIVIGLVYGANWYFFNDFTSRARSSGLPEGHAFFKMIEAQHHQLDLVCAWTCGGMFIGITIFGLLYSHRIAGPLYRLNADLNKMADGSPLKDIRFRKGDLFPEIAASFNRFLSRVQKDISRPS